MSLQVDSGSPRPAGAHERNVLSCRELRPALHCLVLGTNSEQLLEGASQVQHPVCSRYSINIWIKNVWALFRGFTILTWEYPTWECRRRQQMSVV